MSKYRNRYRHLIPILTVISCLLAILVSVMITVVVQRVKNERIIEALTESHKMEMDVLRNELEKEREEAIAEIEKFYEYGGDVSQIESEAEYIAKVIYGVAKNHTAADKKAVVWCILNRVENYAYPDTVEEVCEQPKQWMGYSSDNPVLTNLYELALEELKIWHSNGHRPLSSEYIYLAWSSQEILLRDTFEENKSTRYWRMS